MSTSRRLRSGSLIDTFWSDLQSMPIFGSTAMAKSRSSDIAASVSTTAVVNINQDFVSDINRAGDVDWIRVQLQAGQKYQISLNGQDTGQGSLSDPMIKGLYDSRGRRVGVLSDDDSGEGRNAFLQFEAPSSGSYYIASAAYGRIKGSYTLRVSQDTDAPEVVGISPTDEATEVSLTGHIQITFSEQIQLGEGSIRLLGSDQSELVINIQDSTQVQVTGSVLLLNPALNLNPNTTYTLTIDSGAVRDLVGNHFLGINDSSHTFTTREEVDPLSPIAPVKWNVMVYIAGDNDLESYALQDINEMESVAMYQDLAMTVLLDRSPVHSTADGNWSDTRVARILPDVTNQVVSFSQDSSWGEVNTGHGQTLTDFILWSIENQPAENYALVIWNHGGGIDGIAWDDTSSSHLSISAVTSSIRNAIDYSASDSLNKFELIAMDACLMGMAEVAYPLVTSTNFFVASEELIPGTGFAYDNWLDIFANSGVREITTMDLVTEALNSYAVEYQGQRGITLSALDMSLFDDFTDSLNQFTTIAVNASSKDISNMTKTIGRAVDFPADQSYDYADLAHAMDLIAANRSIKDQTLKTAALSVSNAIDQMVVGEVGSVSAAQGLSIYMPYGSERIDVAYTQENFSFLQAVPLWDDFLRII